MPKKKPRPTPDDKPVAIDPDDALIDDPKDDAFEDEKPNPDENDESQCRRATEAVSQVSAAESRFPSRLVRGTP